MSKKNLKRSLALSALMAFVITGSAMAADYTQRQELAGGSFVAGDTFTVNPSNTNYGGAIRNNGAMDITGATFESNLLTVNGNYCYGGAIYNAGGATLELTDTDFINNQTKNTYNKNGQGGAIYNAGGDLTITGGSFVGNVAEAVTSTGEQQFAMGGAIYNCGNGSLTVTGTVFEGNKGNEGGAIVTNGGPTVITDAEFKNNEATMGGGAINIQPGKKVTLSGDNTFTDNKAADGGAILVWGGADAGVLDINGTATFTGNTANGVANDIDNDGAVNIKQNATVTLDGGMTGSGTTTIGKDAVLTGVVDGNKMNLNGGTWNVTSDSTVNSITGTNYEVAGTGEQSLTVTNTKNTGDVDSNGIYSTGTAKISGLEKLDVTSANRHALEVATKMEITDVGTVTLTSNNGNGAMVYGDLTIDADELNITAPNSHGIRAAAQDGHDANVDIDVTDLTITATKAGETALKVSSGAVIDVVATGTATVVGDIEAKDTGSVGLTLNGAVSSLTGAVKTVDGAQTTLTMSNGATWNVTGDSNLSVLAGSGANIKVGDRVTSIEIQDNQNDDVNLSKDATGQAVTKEDLKALKDIVKVATGQEIKVDATLTNAYLTGDVTLDEAGLMNTKIDTDRFVVSGSVRANGITSLKDVYAFDGKGKFNSLNETAAGVEANKQAIDTNAADIATNKDAIEANKQAIADEVADREAADAALDKAIGENRNDIAANRDAIESIQDVANKNAADIAVNSEAIQDLQDATNKNAFDIAANKDAIEANKQAIADEVADRIAADNALSDKIDSVAGDIVDTKVQVEENKAAIADNAQAIENEVADRVAADNKLQQNIDKETVDRQIADAQERAERITADAKEEAARIEADAKERAERIEADAKEAQARQEADAAIDQKFTGEVGRLDNRIDRVDDKVDKVGAMAAAMASLKTMGYDPEAPTEIAVGVGQYRNETGLAIGAFHYPNKDFMLNFSLSTAGDEVMGGIGATWKIGRKKPEGETMEDKVAKAEAMKKAAKAARVKAQQARHAKMLAEKSK